MSGVAESLFATLFPADCRLCGSPLVKISRLPVCEECLSAMRPITGGTCGICGERLHGEVALEDKVLCGLCRRIEPPYVQATAYGSYEGGLRELIHLLKYEGVRTAAPVLGRMLREATEDLRKTDLVVVPVPLHSRKMRQRGFNQAEEIARAALKGAANGFKLCAGTLERQRETESQIGLTSHQRRENMRGAFKAARPGEFFGREVLLVDDVFTTGTTVSECARVLRRAGASKVYVATVARTLKNTTTYMERDPEIEARFAMAAAR